MKRLQLYFVVILLFKFSFIVMGEAEFANKKMILIGAGGNKGLEYFDLLKNHVNFVAFVQPNPRENLIAVAQREQIKIYSDLDQALEEVVSDGALITVPHYLHFPYTKKCLELGMFVIKEKPFVMNNDEINFYKKICGNDQLPLFIIVQRQFQRSFVEAKKYLESIGKIYSFKYEYNLNLNDITQGWRAKKLLSGGGVLIDMGYHVVDIINTYFGLPMSTLSLFSYKTEMMKKEGLEDEIFITFSYPDGLNGLAIISRYGSIKKESFEISGSEGTIIVTPYSYVVYNKQGSVVVQSAESSMSKKEDLLAMFTCYLEHIHDLGYIQHELDRHEENSSFIQNAYQLQKNNI